MIPTAPVSFDPAERWLVDSLRVLRPSAGFFGTSVDMTEAMVRLEALRKAGVAASATHLLISAAAKAFAANPALHQVVAGSRRTRPERIDIGLSVTGETFIAPVLVIEAADRKSIAEIAEETTRRTPEVKRLDSEKLAGLRKWGGLVPFAFLRRAFMRLAFSNPKFRQQTAGTFQVSTVPMEWAATSVFVATGVLVGGTVHSRVVARNNAPVVRPIMEITLSGDHSVWDGKSAARFLAAVKSELERRVTEP